MSNIRQERANAEILKALSLIIQNKINDPRIKREFITLTYCKTSVDFRHCKVGFSVLSGNKNRVLEILSKSEGFIKRELTKMVKIPYAPEIEFVVDIGEENSERVNKLLEQIEIPPQEEDEEEDN